MGSPWQNRFWWVQRYGGGLFALGCLTGVVYSLWLAYDFSRLEQGGFLDPRILQLNVAQSFLMAGTFAVFFAQAVVALCAPRSAQRRFLRRLRAIAGEQEAMPCASMKVDRRHAPDLSRGPLELPPSRWVSLGLSSQEFRERHQALLDLIVARTGLVPRTLDAKLGEAG